MSEAQQTEHRAKLMNQACMLPSAPLLTATPVAAPEAKGAQEHEVRATLLVLVHLLVAGEACVGGNVGAVHRADLGGVGSTLRLVEHGPVQAGVNLASSGGQAVGGGGGACGVAAGRRHLLAVDVAGKSGRRGALGALGACHGSLAQGTRVACKIVKEIVSVGLGVGRVLRAKAVCLATQRAEKVVHGRYCHVGLTDGTLKVLLPACATLVSSNQGCDEA